MNRTTVAHGQTAASTRQLRAAERILVVNDAEVVREYTSLILTTAGYECLTVSSGYEALAPLKAGERFDLMVCDLLNNPHGIVAGAHQEKVPQDASSHSHGSVLRVYRAIRRQKHGCQCLSA